MTILEDTRNRLIAKLYREARVLKTYDDYFEGEQAVRYISPVLREELGGRITELIINLCRFGVEAYDNRLDVEGFRFTGNESADDDLWAIHQMNDGDQLSQEVHEEHLALSRAYVIVGPGDDASVPLITAESPFECIHELDPRSHDISAGIKRWMDPDGTQWLNLYTAETRTTWWRDKGTWREDVGVAATYDNPLCRMVPIVHKPRTLGRHRPGRRDQRLGRPVFHDIIPLVDAIVKFATDMMVSGEFHAMPRRWAVGLKEDDFTDPETGKALATWSLIAGRIWASENEKAEFGQFAEADLKNFHDTIKLLIQLASQLLGLPPHYNAFVGDNPASADAIRSSEAQLVKRAERLQTVLSGRWERVQRLVMIERTGVDLPTYRQIETLWRDPSTPTVAQKADATTKLVGTKDGRGRSLLPIEQAREDLGYTSEQRKRMAEMDRELDPLVAGAMRTLNDAGGAGAA